MSRDHEKSCVPQWLQADAHPMMCFALRWKWGLSIHTTPLCGHPERQTIQKPFFRDMGTTTFLFKTVSMETRHRMRLKMFLLRNWWKIDRLILKKARVNSAVMTGGRYTFSLNAHGLCFYRSSQTWTVSPVMCTHVVPSGLVQASLFFLPIQTKEIPPFLLRRDLSVIPSTHQAFLSVMWH